MRTLDEVIESITTQSGLEIRNVRKPERDRFWVDRQTYNDALHYLKTYRENQQTCIENSRKAKKARELYLESAEELNALRDYWAEQQENPALTWDELKTMEGKPVWVEYGKDLCMKSWGVIFSFTGRTIDA